MCGWHAWVIDSGREAGCAGSDRPHPALPPRPISLIQAEGGFLNPVRRNSWVVSNRLQRIAGYPALPACGKNRLRPRRASCYVTVCSVAGNRGSGCRAAASPSKKQPRVTSGRTSGVFYCRKFETTTNLDRMRPGSGPSGPPPACGSTARSHASPLTSRRRPLSRYNGTDGRLRWRPCGLRA